MFVSFPDKTLLFLLSDAFEIHKTVIFLSSFVSRQILIHYFHLHKQYVYSSVFSNYHLKVSLFIQEYTRAIARSMPVCQQILNFNQDFQFYPTVKVNIKEKKLFNSPAIIIIQMVNIFSLSVSAATLPNPTLVIHVIVKYSAVTYMVFLDGPFISSGGELESFDQM